MKLAPLSLLISAVTLHQALGPPPPPVPVGYNLALVATASTSFVSGHEKLGALNDGATPRESGDKSHGTYGNWPQHGTQWVQYDWQKPVCLGSSAVYWFNDGAGIRLPKACRLKYWDGHGFADIPGAAPIGITGNQPNLTSFPEIKTTKLRLEIDAQDQSSTGVLEWMAYDSGNSPNLAPVASAGVDRVVVMPGMTYLTGTLNDDGKPKPELAAQWSKVSGPGDVTFSHDHAANTEAGFSAPGDYVLKLLASDGELSTSSVVHVTAIPAPTAGHLDPVWTTRYQVSSPFWQPRLKNLIVNWIPHCVQMCEDPNGKYGGIDNFVQAGKKLAGKPGAKHTGPVFANTWVYNTLESMCIAQMLDPQGDTAIASAQAAMRKTIDDWVAKMLSAQEPDGYLHTEITISGRPRWSVKEDHEDYQAGYFIEAAIAHHLMTGGKDTRMLDAAKRLADCWVKNIGPAPKHAWYPGHQEMEMALVKLARYIEKSGDSNHAASYVAMAKYLLDSRQNGDEYDQSHVTASRQYEAVGHAVRAIYSYCGMADVAMETGDPDYLSATQSLWTSIVNRKYYVTGGIGSGETTEGFGKDYSLPHNAYCESCSNCGELYFQTKMQMIHRDARYADLAEETLFNAILGDVDLDAQNYTYTNPLDSDGKRYKWHVCPCCIGNIPRTLLSLPTWTYTQGKDEADVNLYVGSTITLDHLAGTSVKFVQTTDYPWNGKAELTLHPAKPATFTLKLRVPNRNSSDLYAHTPNDGGFTALTINGKSLTPAIEHGYAVVTREWKDGDRVALDLPLPVQRIKGSEKIAATTGQVALRRGPLVYNIESVDQNIDSVLAPDAPLTTEWKADMLGGIQVVKGTFTDGKPMLAIPNYARLNRGGRSRVWIHDR